MSLNRLPQQKNMLLIFVLIVVSLLLILLGVRLRRVS
jgi:hypothetical protein